MFSLLVLDLLFHRELILAINRKAGLGDINGHFGSGGVALVNILQDLAEPPGDC